jgi:hypothetical protein
LVSTTNLLGLRSRHCHGINYTSLRRLFAFLDSTRAGAVSQCYTSRRAWEAASGMAKKKLSVVPPKLTDTEQDLLWHMEHGYQLETDSLGGNPILRLKSGEVIRPVAANRNTIRGLEERGLIASGEGREPLTLLWRLKKKSS